MFHGYYGSLVRSLTVVAGDQQTAEDAVQEAFAQAHLRWSKISKYEDPVAWVRRVAINRLFNVHRGRRRRSRALSRLGTLRGGATDEATRVSDQVDVVAALRQLTQRQRLAVALYYIEDLAVGEVAVALGMSEGTVKSHLHRAREVLRKTIEVPE
jgi:RNA polymerase sigma-70 factor (ECF subfamily)